MSAKTRRLRDYVRYYTAYNTLCIMLFTYVVLCIIRISYKLHNVWVVVSVHPLLSKDLFLLWIFIVQFTSKLFWIFFSYTSYTQAARSSSLYSVAKVNSVFGRIFRTGEAFHAISEICHIIQYLLVNIEYVYIYNTRYI